MYLTRARLADDISVKALAPVLLAGGDASHRLVWSLMTDGPERERDFLFREQDGVLYVLSERQPPGSPLWEHETRALPSFETGDRVRFQLRANPVIRRKRDDGKTIKLDPIMDRLHGMSTDERRERRWTIAAEETEAWLRRIGEASGYHLDAFALDAYRQERMRRGVQFSVVEVSGVLTVTDAAAFRDRLRQGFGASRAWGCGLMLCRQIDRW